MQISLRRVCALLFVVAGAASAHAEDVLFSAQDNTPIATLTREHGMVRGVTDEPLVTVFGNGLVRIERAPYMINPGVSEIRLQPEELNALVATLSATFDLTTQQLERERDAAASALSRSSGEQFFTLDSTITKLSISLDSFSRDGKPAAPVRTTLALADIQEQALRYDIPGLQSLARAEKALLALMKTAAEAEGAGNEK